MIVFEGGLWSDKDLYFKSQVTTNVLCVIFLSLFILEQEREQVSGEEAEREGKRESQAGSALLAQSLTQGSIS